MKFWFNGACPTGTTAVGNDGRCQFTPATAEQGFNGHNNMGELDSNAISQILGGTYTPPAASSSPMTVYFKAMTKGEKPVFTVWQSEQAYGKCVDNSGNYTFKISDGTTNIAVDLPATVASSNESNVASNLISYMQTQMGSAINQFAPVLNILDMGTTVDASSATVTCQIPYDLDWRAQNMEPDQLTACESDVSNNGCASFKNSFDNDYRNALWRYKSSKIFAGVDASADPVFTSGLTLSCANKACDFNFSDNLAPGNTTVQTGVFTGWTANGPEITATTGASEVELGGCVVWKNGQATIIKEGDFFTRENGVSEKCTWNERRLVVAGTSSDYSYVVNGNYYKDATYFIEVNTVKKPVWSKMCEISFNSNTWVDNQSPVRTEQEIKDDIANRAGGRGNAEDRAGMKFRILHRWIASKDGPGSNSVDGNERFYYGSGEYTCSEVVNASFAGFNATTTWDNIGNIVKYSDDWRLSSFMACFLVGLANDTGNRYTDMLNAWSPSGGDVGIKTALQAIVDNADYKDLVGDPNNIPDKIDSLTSNSCMPNVDISRVCNSSGCGEPKVICTTGSLANGGCDSPAPSSRMASMEVTPLGGGLYSFFNFDERFRYKFDPSTNSGSVCTETEFMTIFNKDAVTSTVAGGTTLTLQFNESSTEVCDGEVGNSDPAPKKFMNFYKTP